MLPPTPKTLALLAALAASSARTAAAAACTRAALLAAAQTYIAAQATGNTTALARLFAPGATPAYRQNNEAAAPAAPGSLLLSRPLALDHARTTADPAACASYTELISVAGPYVIGTQVRHSPDTAAVALVDSVVATAGDWAFDAAATLAYVAPEDWGVLPAARQSPRRALRAAADAYLDMWSNGTAIGAVPWGDPCARTEGSAHVSPDCRAGAPSGGGAAVQITDRRYVIDEEVGSCNVLNAFGNLPDSHEFRLVSGKLVLMHTITV